MFNRIRIREIPAWMTLAIALILFSVTIAFAQTKTINIENEDGKVHIKIIKTENGKTVRIDTTFIVTDDMNVDEIIESLGDPDGANSPSHSGIRIHKDDDHIVIIGDKDEKPPVLEKVISSKKGKQIFVYKRSGSSRGSGKNEKDTWHDDQKANKPDIHNLHYYPNPTSGKIKLTFRSDEKGDITIQVLDGNSKEVFSEKINDFEGGYSKEIDLGGRSKGNYFLKIVQGEKSITKKIVLN